MLRLVEVWLLASRARSGASCSPAAGFTYSHGQHIESAYPTRCEARGFAAFVDEITATYARNKGHLWSSLRSALSHYPALAAQVPDKAGPVDDLPLWGVAKVAVLKDKRVVQQGRPRGSRPSRACARG
jgi:hypothetical protein